MNPVAFQAYGGFGREVHVDATRITHWDRVDFNGMPGVRLYTDTGREILVDGHMHQVGTRLALAKDAALRSRVNGTVSPVIAAAAKACMYAMANPHPREELDLDLVTAVCAYLMEQAA